MLCTSYNNQERPVYVFLKKLCKTLVPTKSFQAIVWKWQCHMQAIVCVLIKISESY